MLKHWQTVLAAAAAAAVLAATMVASLTIPAQAYPPPVGRCLNKVRRDAPQNEDYRRRP